MPNELLVPRNPISFIPLEEGRFVPLSNNVPEILKQPMVRTKNGTLKGYESGWRSGLLHVDNQLYKIKSCRPVGGAHGSQPRGSSTLSSAQFDADNTLERRESFLKAGFDYPLEPIGFWVYDNIMFRGEPNTATLYRAKGDTRLDELIWWVERSPYEYASVEYLNLLIDIFSSLGYQTGRRIKNFHDNNFSWDCDPTVMASNAHSGNIIIFPDDLGKIGIGMVDFDISTSYSSGDPKELEETIKLMQKNDFKLFCSWLENFEVFSRARKIRYCGEFTAGWIVDKAMKQIAPELSKEENFDTLGMAGGYLLRLLNPCEDAESIRREVIYGVARGYKNYEPKYDDETEGNISWKQLVKVIKDADKIKGDFIRRLKFEIGPNADMSRINELAKLY